ncbi:O-succinylhomoserine sulfhydrylase [Pontivivens insulae]|uniref:O-succinylhomoserine sulfhydrylase n=1 Tax=Pontivivens insulae TaxID=1639689 RepID=A0A2R8ACJ1_9RHOB|nr:O-succinylhomoserine sulfhydrylase [Pontivivens insulae]RED13873.1 O-succinylhomoserine sulfhydrylase [Pontivivens insulae]SPF29947.1 O-succinylhomoserine sulfhydrylase [Pontivivens insulae]
MTDWNTRTKLVHSGARRSQYGEVAEAIYLTQGFVYPSAEAAEARFIELGDDEFIYARYGNPTVAAFEDRIAALEGAEAAFATASGMAAVNGALFSMLKAGDHVVSSKALFGSCLHIVENLLPRFGVEVTFVDGTDLDQWRAAVRDDTTLVFFETMSNPVLEVIDVAAVAEIAHAKGALVVADNVFATPVFMRAFDLGVDVVIYSATKHIDGQGRCLGGVVLGTEDYIRGTLEPYLKHTGGALSPFNAWVMLNGLTTLDLRVRAQAATAAKVADALAEHDAVAQVLYPGRTDHPQHEVSARQMETGGTMLAVQLAGKEEAFRFLNAAKVGVISNNLGDARTILTHPSTTTHQRLTEDQRLALGITPGTVRISIGLEDADDLISDLSQALSAV